MVRTVRNWVDTPRVVSELRDLVTAPRCEFCDRLLTNGRIYADVDTVDAGIGLALCTRQPCIEQRESMSLGDRVNVYLGHAAR